MTIVAGSQYHKFAGSRLDVRALTKCANRIKIKGVVRYMISDTPGKESDSFSKNGHYLNTRAHNIISVDE